MTRPALFVAVVLVVPAAALSSLLSPTSAETQRKDEIITVRACVQQGTHGSVGNLSQIEVKSPAPAAERRRILYWFYKNIAAFREHVGHLVEITATVTDVLEGPLELKASDGVFAEVLTPAQSAVVPASAVQSGTATAGATPERAAAPAGAVDAADADASETVVKADVSRLRMLGSCR